MSEITITITDIPEDTSPTSLAHAGELLGLEANGVVGNPTAKAWARAGIAASAIMRHTYRGKLSADMLVALIASSTDPTADDETPQRTAIIGGHTSLADMSPEAKARRQAQADRGEPIVFDAAPVMLELD